MRGVSDSQRMNRRPKAPEGFPFPTAIQRMWSVIYFEAAGPDRTEVREVSLGFGTDEESQRMRAFFNQGNASSVSLSSQRAFCHNCGM